MKFKDLKIGTKIILAISFSVLFITIIASFYFYMESKTSLEKQIYNHLLTSVESKKNHIETLLSEYKSQVKRISSRQSFISFLSSKNKPTQINQILAQIKASQGKWGKYERVMLVNPKGIVLAAADEENIGQDLSSYFDSPALQTQRRTLEISAPIRAKHSQKLLGFLLIEYKMSKIDEIATNHVGLGKTGESYLLDKESYILTPSRFSGKFLNHKINTLGSRLAIKSLDHPVSDKPLLYRDYRGIKVLGTHSNIPEMNWALLIELDVKEALSPLQRMKYVLLGIILIIPLLAVITSYYFSLFISKPIIQLKNAAKEVGQGNFDVEIQINSKDEVGELATSFKEMIIDLKKVAEADRKAIQANAQLKFINELEQKNKELEEFHDVVVSRELKMIELEKEIAKLKKKEPKK